MNREERGFCDDPQILTMSTLYLQPDWRFLVSVANAQSVREEFVDLLDTVPTLLDSAGISLDYKPSYTNAQLEGESLMPC